MSAAVIAKRPAAADIARVPRERWAATRVSEAMVPAERVQTVAPESRLLDAMRLLQEHDIHQLPVLQQGRVVGLLSRADVMRHIELRAAFGRREGPGPRARAPALALSHAPSSRGTAWTSLSSEAVASTRESGASESASFFTPTPSKATVTIWSPEVSSQEMTTPRPNRSCSTRSPAT